MSVSSALFPHKGTPGLLRRPSVGRRNQPPGSSGTLSLPVLRTLTQEGGLGDCRGKGFHLPGAAEHCQVQKFIQGVPWRETRWSRGPAALGCFSQWSLCPPPFPGQPLPLLACSSSLLWSLAPVLHVLSPYPQEPRLMVSAPLGRTPGALQYFHPSNQCHLEGVGRITAAIRGHGYGRD